MALSAVLAAGGAGPARAANDAPAESRPEGLELERDDPAQALRAARDDATPAERLERIDALLDKDASGAAARSPSKGTSKGTSKEDPRGEEGSEEAEPRPKPTDAEVTLSRDVLQLPGSDAEKTGASSQVIQLPKGEGTIEGMGESFSTQLSTGVATFGVPFALPSARGAVGASLGLSYSSGGGWGIAGIGWDVGVPYIARQTDRGLPRYEDAADFHSNQDRFVFNGGQELVPICTVRAGLVCEGALPGEAMPPWSEGSQYFRPRVEGSFLRFFWAPNHETWRVQGKQGVTMELGVPLDGTGSRSGLETDPNDRSRIFRWNLVRQYDAQGAANPSSATALPAPVNGIVYRYFKDGEAAYLSDIFDTSPAAAPTTLELGRFAHHTRLVYEERSDPTFSYRSGFRVDRRLRLKRVDVSSKTFNDGEVGARRQLRRYHLSYDSRFHPSLLTSVQVEGRCGSSEAANPIIEDGNGHLPERSECPRLPAMRFAYSHVEQGAGTLPSVAGFEAIDTTVREMSGSPPHSVDDDRADLFDINADALPDVLVTAPGLYGSGHAVFFNGAQRGGSFGAAENMAVSGVLGATVGDIRLTNSNVAPLDLDGDGVIDLLHMPRVKTYSVYRPELSPLRWVGREVTTASQQNPKIDFGRDADRTRVLDVDGDGLVDVVVTTGQEIQTFFSLGRYPGGNGQFGSARFVTATRSAISNDPVRACLPWSGAPISFSDSQIRMADMNGDGLQDIVRLRRGDIQYWPGRGNGFWGTGRRDDCAAPAFGANRHLEMGQSPHYSDIEGGGLRLDDVNGDGLDDLVEIRFNEVDVWLNVDGTSFAPRQILKGMPESPSFANRVRLVDVDGSGTRDILWGNAGRYRYVDLQRGTRPWLLVGVESGLGKSTRIEYGTSTAEMLEAAGQGGACDPEGAPWSSPWCTRMPNVVHVVKRVTETDNLTVAGAGPWQSVMEYRYRDPVYDGRQREFRGFVKTLATSVGDATAPTSFSESTFLLGECEPDPGDTVSSCTDPSLDNPREALKGLPVVTETFDAAGVYLSTSATGYRLRRLYRGRDGRDVRHAFATFSRTLLYDTAATLPSGGGVDLLPLVEIELDADPSYDPIAAPLSVPATLVTESLPVPRRATTGTATLENRTESDRFGNALVSTSFGCVEGSACPQGDVGLETDETLFSLTVPGRPAGDQTGWLWRTVRSYAQGSRRTQVRGDTTTQYDSRGQPTAVTAVLGGTVALDRFHADPAAATAPVPAERSQNGVVTLATTAYDSFGNVIQQQGPNGRCVTSGYDTLPNSGGQLLGYAMLPTVETMFSGGCGVSGLTTSAAYDRGLAAPTTVIDQTGQASFVRYDDFGRLSWINRPKPNGGTGALPSVRISYDLATPARPYSIVETFAEDGPDVDLNQYLRSVAIIDGLGRTRVSRSEADLEKGDGGSAIEAGVTVFDAKGTVARSYLPRFVDDELTAAPSASAPPVDFTSQRYDAFGRVIATFDYDGTQTARTDYHALSADTWDAADLEPFGAHADTFASSRKDGHGRVVATTSRILDDGLERHEVRMRYLVTGEVETITRLRVGFSEAPVVRWMRYDTLGRLVLNVDPHTSENFTSDPSADATPSPGGLKAWRYAYNDAGDLVGTSDARGCGLNFHYDGMGRPTLEDYSPCETTHPPYSAPNLTDHSGVEVFYQYDAVPAGAAALFGAAPSGYDGASPNLRGKLVMVYDRGEQTYTHYDARGRPRGVHKRIAQPSARTEPALTRFGNRWYEKAFTYDAADRLTSETTGAVSPELLGAGGESTVSVTYSKRGMLSSVDSSYGALVTSVTRTADGLVDSIEYGDAATTMAFRDYDSRRRLFQSFVWRWEPSLWSSPPASYQPAPSLDPNDPTTFQWVLDNTVYWYDIVGNPTDIVDYRDPEEWPSGAKPVSRTIEYDDFYRVRDVSYSYDGDDAWVSPYAPELSGLDDPKQTPHFARQRAQATRVQQQSFDYDWLGSLVESGDDLGAFWDRSAGETPPAAGTPYRWNTAGDPSAVSSGTGAGAVATDYDATGNLLGIQMRGGIECVDPSPSCLVELQYAYDEVGRLERARRVEDGVVRADLLYTYDAGDMRVVKSDQLSSPNRDAVYIFPSLELRRIEPGPSGYEPTVDSEVVQLVAGGVRLARVVVEGPNDGEPRLSSTSAQHVFLYAGDHLGSTNIVIDKATSELVEYITYMAYGATESDYRPERWKGFREDYRFTGKEEDSEVGLVYFGKRFLIPAVGRWLTPDPLAVHLPGQADLNLYAYVHARVFKNTDPLGLCDDIDACIAGDFTTSKIPELAALGDTRVEAAPDAAPQGPGPNAGGSEGASGTGEEFGAGGSFGAAVPDPPDSVTRYPLEHRILTEGPQDFGEAVELGVEIAVELNVAVLASVACGTAPAVCMSVGSGIAAGSSPSEFTPDGAEQREAEFYTGVGIATGAAEIRGVKGFADFAEHERGLAAIRQSETIPLGRLDDVSNQPGALRWSRGYSLPKNLDAIDHAYDSGKSFTFNSDIVPGTRYADEVRRLQIRELEAIGQW